MWLHSVGVKIKTEIKHIPCGPHGGCYMKTESTFPHLFPCMFVEVFS